VEKVVITLAMLLFCSFSFAETLNAVLASQPDPISGGTASSRVLPFKVSQRFHCILLEGVVNGKAASLLLDTGSSHIILRPEIVQLLGSFQAAPPAKGSALGGAGRWTKANMNVGNQTWLGHDVLAMSGVHDVQGSIGQKVDGILGEGHLNEFREVTINYQTHSVTMTR